MKNKGLRRKTEMIDRLLIFIAKHPHFLPECVLRALFVFLSRIVWLLKAGGVKQFERNLSRVLKYRMKTARDADSKNNSAGQKAKKSILTRANAQKSHCRTILNILQKQ